MSPARRRAALAVSAAVGMLIPAAVTVPAAAAMSVNVAAYGAVPGDAGDDTEGFVTALAAVSAAGGGTVRTAAGVYRVRPDRLVLGDKVAVTGSGTVLTAADHGFTLLTMRSGTTLSGVTVEGDDKVVRGVTVAAGSTDVRLTSVTVRNIAPPRRPGVPGFADNHDEMPVGIRVSGDSARVLLDKVTVDGVRAAAKGDPQVTVTGDFEGQYPMWPTWRRETAADAYSATTYPHSWQLVDAPVRAGTRAYRSELRSTDPRVMGSARSELTQPAEPARQEHWYGFSILLPEGGDEDWATDSSAEVVAQWHNSPDPAEKDAVISPPLALLTRNGGWELHRWWDERETTNNSLMWHAGKHEETPLGSYEADQGRWTDWAFHVRWGWAAEQQPMLEVFKNRRPVYRSTGPNTTNDVVGNYFKMGIYKWDWAQGNPSQTTRRVIYHDEFRVDDAGGSLDTVSPPNAHLTGDARYPVARGILIDAGAGQTIPRNVTVRGSTVRNVGPKDDGDCLVAQAQPGETQPDETQPDETQPDANLLVTGNTFTGCAKRAVKIQVPGATVSTNKITNPFLGTNPYVVRAAALDTTDMFAGISVYASRVTVTGNTIAGAGSYYAGIDVDNGPLSGVTITRNTVANGTGSRTAPSSAIRLHTAVTGLNLQGNTVGNAAYGVRCDAVPPGPVFAPNTARSVTTAYAGCVGTPAVTAPAALRPTGGDQLTITGQDFGATATQFKTLKITATVGGRTVPLTWLDAGTLRAATPAGALGTQPVLVLARGGVTATPVPLPGRYAATITSGASGFVSAATGATISVRGAGFSAATGWRLDGPATVALPRLDSRAALAALPAGVWVSSDTTATVKVPPAPDTDADGRRDLAAYALRLTPADGVPYLGTTAALTYR
jgi:hypothetical protein